MAWVAAELSLCLASRSWHSLIFEVLAGYNIVECATFDRATEIAAELTKCPYPGGASAEFFVDVRPVAEGGAEDLIG